MDFNAQAPDDSELKNVIDKLAQFVARNGVEFERMTKEKQKGNPKFSFLFGGEFYGYYQYKLTTEQALMRKQQHQQQSSMPPHGAMMRNVSPGTNMSAFPSNGPPHMGQGNFHVPPPNFVPPWSNRPPMSMPLPPPPIVGPPSTMPPNMGGPSSNMPPTSMPPHGPTPHFAGPPPPGMPPPHIQMHQLQRQLDEWQDKLQSSERNLVAQHESLMSQKQNEIEQLRLDIPRKAFHKLSDTAGLLLEEFDTILNPVVEACTKDNIATAKTWIFAHLQTQDHYDLFSLLLFHRAIMLSNQGHSKFEPCLHLVYLVNDLLHHSVRKHSEGLRMSLQRVVPAVFSEAVMTSNGDDEKVAKLVKLISLWRQNKYVDERVLELLEDTQNVRAGRNVFLSDVMQIVNRVLPQAESQFAFNCNEVEKKFNQQYVQLQNQNKEYAAHCQSQMMQINQMMNNVANHMHGPPHQFPPFPQPPPSSQPMGGQKGPWSSPPPPLLPPPQQNLPPPLYGGNGCPQPPPLLASHDKSPGVRVDTSRPPPQFMGNPPGFNPPNQRPITPPAPYYDLPAGLIVPLVKPEDNSYEPIDPMKVRLPPPCPPTERLLAAVEAFYAAPSHDNPRDSEGWERLGLYEFYQTKERAIKEAKSKRQVSTFRRSRSRSRSSSSSSSSRSQSSTSRSRSRSASPLPYLRSSRSRSRSPPQVWRGIKR